MKGEELRKIRERSGLSQTELAAYLGVSASLVSRMETGKRRIKPGEERKIRELIGNQAPARDPCGQKPDGGTRQPRKGPEAEARAGGNAGRYTVYTDGGCAYNPGGPGGIGVVILDDGGKVVKEISKGYGPTTNNRMEISAAIEALRAIPEGSRVLLYSDSQYLVNTMRGLFRIKKNVDLWNTLRPLNAARKVEYRWVRGHDGNRYNERCDELATKAMQSGSSVRPSGGRNHGTGGGAMAVQIGSLPEACLLKGYAFAINPSCREGIRKFEAGPKAFRDYMRLKTGGMDGWSRAGNDWLMETAGEEACKELEKYLDRKGVLSCLRWHGRGLSLKDSVRKVLVDQEVSSNCNK